MVHCYGRNELGMQSRPCSFLLRPASPPESVRNCELLPGGSKQAQQALATAAAASGTSIGINETPEQLASESVGLPLEGSSLSASSKSAQDLVTLHSKMEEATGGFVEGDSFPSGSEKSPFNGLSTDSSADAGSWPWKVNWEWAERAAVLRCESGQSGGLRAYFRLELYDIDEQRLQANLSAGAQPVFLLAALKPNARYSANVYASNAKGRSASVSLSFHTFAAQISNAKKQGN